SEAIALFQQALLFESKLHRPNNFATLNRQLGDALLKADRLNEALEQFTKTNAIESISHDENLQAELHSRLVLVHFLLEDTASAKKHYEIAINSYRLLDEPSPGIIIGETWNSFILDSRKFWTLRDGMRSLETSSVINQDALAMLADTINTLTSSLDKLYSLDKSNNQLFIPIVTPLVLEVGDNIVPKVDSKTDGGKFLFEDIPYMRDERIKKNTGVVIPGVRARGNPNIGPDQFVIQLDEVSVIRGSVKVGKGYCPALPEVIRQLGVPIEAIATNPLNGEEGCWVSFDYQDKLKTANLEPWGETLFIIYQIEAILRRNLANFLGIQEAETMLENHALTAEGKQQIAAALPDRQSRLHFARLLRTLVKENIKIANIGEILQASQEMEINGENLDQIVRHIRLRNKTMLPGNQPGVQRFVTPPDMEEKFNGWVSMLHGKTKFMPPPDETHDLIREIARLVPSPNRHSVLVVQNYQIRPFLGRLLENRYPDLIVIAAEELDKTAISHNKSKD
ncbi:MAG: FHIPEP family type III secretion protein, partial [Chitinophagaceae bacterium]